MHKYTYPWFLNSFQNAKTQAEGFLLSVNEVLFNSSPTPEQWSIAQCYSHLIQFGNLYDEPLAAQIESGRFQTDHPEQAFPPRWLAKRLIAFFEPPSGIKVKTFSSMEPEQLSGRTRIEVMDEYLSFQDRLIAQLRHAKDTGLDLRKNKFRHPLLSVVKLSLGEGFALIEVHQRRHQWQAEQILQRLKDQAVTDH